MFFFHGWIYTISASTKLKSEGSHIWSLRIKWNRQKGHWLSHCRKLRCLLKTLQQKEQKCIRVGCVPPALYQTGDGVSLWGVSVQGGLPDRDSLDRTPPDRDPQTETPRQRPHKEHGTRDRPLEGTWDQRQRPPGRNMGPASQTGVTSYRDPPCEQNDWQTGVKTLPSATSFAGWKYSGRLKLWEMLFYAFHPLPVKFWSSPIEDQKSFALFLHVLCTNLLLPCHKGIAKYCDRSRGIDDNMGFFPHTWYILETEISSNFQNQWKREEICHINTCDISWLNCYSCLIDRWDITGFPINSKGSRTI